MNSPVLTIGLVSFNSYDFIANSIYAFERLTVSDWKLYICDNGSNFRDLNRLRILVSNYPNIYLYSRSQSSFGSSGHGEGLNFLKGLIDTKYFAIFDADCTPLLYGWDIFCIEQLDNGYQIVGTPVASNSPGNSLRDRTFPTIFMCFGNSKLFLDYDIDFRPRDIAAGEDTGWHIKEVFKNNSLRAYSLFGINTRSLDTCLFGNVICDEYYINENCSQLICSHFGRGSNPRSGKYRNSLNKYYSFSAEKRRWIKKCVSIILTQVQSFKRISPDISIEFSPCWNCHSSDFSLLYLARDRYTNFAGIWEIVSCNKCGSIRTLLRLKKESLLRLYSVDYPVFPFLKSPTKNTVNTSYWSSKFRSFTRDFLLSSFLNYRHLSPIRIPSQFYIFFSLAVRSYYEMLIPVFPSNSSNKLLEIGCSDGSFLSFLKSLGWDTTGIDISSSAMDSTLARSLHIHNQSFDDFDSQGNTYNCIVMRMVLESLPSPTGTIQKVHNLLDIDGVLLLSVPNFSGLESRLFRQFSYTLQAPTHLSHFTVDSLSELLHSCGFYVQKITHHTFHRDLRAGLQYLSLEKPSLLLTVLLKLPLPLFKIISYTLGLFGMSSRVSIYAKKI